MQRNEYRSVQLTINNKPRTFTVHRLVAEAGKAVGTYGTTIKRAMDANRLCKGYYWKENK